MQPVLEVMVVVMSLSFTVAVHRVLQWGVEGAPLVVDLKNVSVEIPDSIINCDLIFKSN